MEESRREVRGADSTLRKEAYGRNFLYHCNSTTWTFYGLRRTGPRVLEKEILCENLFVWIHGEENGLQNGSFFNFGLAT